MIEKFLRDPVVHSQAIRQMRDSDRSSFVDASLRALAQCPDSPGSPLLLRMLLGDPLALERVADTKFFASGDAVTLFRWMLTLDSGVDAQLVRVLRPAGDSAVCDPGRALRVLEILEVTTDGSRIQSFLPALLRHPDSRVRSKVALLAGRFNQNLAWVEQRMAEPDSRVRANAVESLWGANSPQACLLFVAGTKDPHHRVAGNGLVGLYRAGDLRAIRLSLELAAHSDPMFRAATAWAMGESEDPRFLPVLARMIERERGCVRQNALRATVRIRKRIDGLESGAALCVGVTKAGTRLQVNVQNASGEGRPKLPATAFVVTHQDGPIEVTEVLAGPAAGDYQLAISEPDVEGIRVCVYAGNSFGDGIVM